MGKNYPKAVSQQGKIQLIIFLILLAVQQLNAQIHIGPVDDSYIYQGGPKADEVYGVLNPNELITRKSVASPEYTRETYCMFNMGGQAVSFSEARLQLYGKVVESKTVEVYYSDTAWTEETLTGSSRPPGTFIGSSFLEAGEGYYSWDVTTFVNSARSAGANRISFVLKDIAFDVSTIDTKWHSKENPSGKGPGLVITPGDPPEIYYGNYYVDMTGGSDNNSGHTPAEAWKTLLHVNNILLQPGDSLLFRSGDEWTGTFSVKGSGLPGKPIVIGKYGGEKRPVIHGAGLAANTISFFGQEYIELRDLEITNFGAGEALRCGVYYNAMDMGPICHVVFDNLEVHDVNGTMEEKNNGGIFIEITGTSIPTWFDTLVVSNCHIHDVNRTGLSNASYWDTRTLTDNGIWTPSRNVHIHHNTFERTGANALIVRAAHKPIMEYNLFSHCSILGSGNASFSFNTDSAIWQYNEACYTKFNEGDNDAGGFDSDYKSKYTIIQYNYSHDNEYGGVLLTGGPGTGDGFNEGTIIRYNVFANNLHHNFRISGNQTNSRIYNNVIYTGPGLDNVMQVWHKTWGGSAADETYYWNNIFYNLGNNTAFELTTSTNNEFSHNVYYGNPILGEPADPFGTHSDPVLSDPAGGADGFNEVYRFMINTGSSAIDMGRVVEGTVGRDIRNNRVPFGTAPDIGAFEWQVDTVDILIIVKDENKDPVEGALISMEGYGRSNTGSNGQILINDVLTGGLIPVLIDYPGYPSLAGSIDPDSDDTLTFFLSKNVFDLRFIVSDDEGSPLENAEIVIPGLDTLLTDAKGELLFAGLAESVNILYRARADGHHAVTDRMGLFKNDTATVTMDPRWIAFQARDNNGLAIRDVAITLEGYGSVLTDVSGTASFTKILSDDTLVYSAVKRGFIENSGTVTIGKDNLSVLLEMEVVKVTFMVIDTLLQPVGGAAVLFMDQLKYTGAAGTVQFEGVPLNESLPVSIYQTGYKTYEGNVQINATGQTVYVKLAPPEHFSVSFEIKDISGEAISGAMVTLTGYGAMITDLSGIATFENVLASENMVYTVSKQGFNDTINFISVVDADVLIKITLSGPSGTGGNSPSSDGRPVLFPNPASDHIVVHVAGDRPEKVSILNLAGQIILTDPGISENPQIQVGHLKSGLYLLRLETKSVVSIHKFIKL